MGWSSVRLVRIGMPFKTLPLFTSGILHFIVVECGCEPTDGRVGTAPVTSPSAPACFREKEPVFRDGGGELALLSSRAGGRRAVPVTEQVVSVPAKVGQQPWACGRMGKDCNLCAQAGAP